MPTIRPAWSLTVLALLLIAPFVVRGYALAVDPQVTVVGGAAIPTHAPSTDQVTYTVSVGDGPVDGVVLHAHQPAGLPAQAASVIIDGAPAAAGTVDQAGAGLVVRLGAGADPTHGGTLDTGNHTVTFDVAVTRLPTSSASAYAVVDYVVTGQTRHTRSATIPLALPDLRLAKPAHSGEGRTLPLGTGVDGDFEAVLTNPGGTAAAATLTISLPAGLGVDRSFGIYRDDQYRSISDTGGTRLHCTSPTRSLVRCALGTVDSGTNTLIDVPVQPAASARAGTTGTFTVSALSDNGLDADRSDNSVHGSVRFTGTAHLAVRLVPGTLRVTVGRTGRLVASIRNDGPNRAVQALGLIALRGNHFSITHFSGKQLASPGSSSGLAHARWGARSTRSPTAAVTDAGVPLVLWNAGTIRPGGTAHATITLKARSAGRDELLLGADSQAGNPPCQRSVPTRQCKAFAFATLRAVKRAAQHLPSSASSTPAGPSSTAPSSTAPSRAVPSPVLAETGPHSSGTLTVAGLTAIAAGTVLLLLGSARRGARAH